jgi:hypothetical protein
MRWTILYAKSATEDVRKIPRGPAAEVTAAISSLASVQRPYAAFPSLDRPTVYILPAAGYYVNYELNEQERIVRILTIE